jgi:hypothetical protein
VDLAEEGISNMFKWFWKKREEPIYTQSQVDQLLCDFEKKILETVNTIIISIPKSMTPEEIYNLVNQRAAIIDPAPFDSIFGRTLDLVRTSMAEVEYEIDNRFNSLSIPSNSDFYKLLNEYINLRIISFDIQDKSIKAGNNTNCKISFNKPIPEYGCEVFINCDNPDVMCPNFLVIEKGQTQAEFEIKTFLGSEKYTAHLSVFLHSQEKTIQMNVSPPTK